MLRQDSNFPIEYIQMKFMLVLYIVFYMKQI